MRIKVIDRLEHPGTSGFSEDTAYAGTDIYWVADGASTSKKDTFAGYESYAMWFTQLFRQQFEKIAPKSVPFPELVKRCIDSIEQKFPLSDMDWYDKPSFTLSALQIDGEYTRLYSIGDCAIYILKHDGTTESLYDNRVDPFSMQTIREVQTARRTGKDVTMAIRTQTLKNRVARNQQGGFWVVGYGGRYEEEFLTDVYRTTDIKRILICSDGFIRIFKEFNLFTATDILTGTFSLDEAYRALRTYETKHEADTDFPCVKTHDDVTALLIEFA